MFVLDINVCQPGLTDVFFLVKACTHLRDLGDPEGIAIPDLKLVTFVQARWLSYMLSSS